MTTWESPAPPGNNRRNRYRNQIDYILVKKHGGIQLTNSRSYAGTQTSSDHKIVILDCIMKWPYFKRISRKPKINVDNLQNEAMRNEYIENVKKNINEAPESSSTQSKWNLIVKSIQKAATDSLGLKQKAKHQNNPDIDDLSNRQKNIRVQINTANDQSRIETMRKETPSLQRYIFESNT